MLILVLGIVLYAIFIVVLLRYGGPGRFKTDYYTNDAIKKWYVQKYRSLAEEQENREEV